MAGWVWWWEDSKSPSGRKSDGADQWFRHTRRMTAQIIREQEQWRRVAPLALQRWREVLSGEVTDPHDAHVLFSEIEAMQSVLFAIWRCTGPIGWKKAFFYRTITHDCRRLLTDCEVPAFDPDYFARLVRIENGQPIPAAVRAWLIGDPVIRGIAELASDLADPIDARSPTLRLIQGGRRSSHPFKPSALPPSVS
jgi:hypothetical protein